MIRWTGFAPWEYEFPFTGSLTTALLRCLGTRWHRLNAISRPPPLFLLFLITHPGHGPQCGGVEGRRACNLLSLALASRRGHGRCSEIRWRSVVWGSGFRVQGIMVQGSGFRVQGTGRRVQGSELRLGAISDAAGMPGVRKPAGDRRRRDAL